MPTPIGTQPRSSVDPLREAAASSGKLVGTAIQSAFLSDGRYTAVFNRHFNYVQKSVYHSIVGPCVAEPRCHGVTFWASRTRTRGSIRSTGNGDAQLLFDTQYAAKPPYFGVLDAFRRR